MDEKENGDDVDQDNEDVEEEVAGCEAPCEAGHGVAVFVTGEGECECGEVVVAYVES